MNRSEPAWSGERVDGRNFTEFGFDIRRGREIKHRFTCLSGNLHEIRVNRERKELEPRLMLLSGDREGWLMSWKRQCCSLP